MKQNITSEQIEELTSKKKQKLFDYWWDNENPKHMGNKYRSVYIHQNDNCKWLPLLTIGQMIELIHEKFGSIQVETGCGCSVVSTDGIPDSRNIGVKCFTGDKDNVCDTLWQVIKEIL